MISIYKTFGKLFILFSLFFLTSCANREVQDLQSTVSDLENKLSMYQVQANRESQETTTTLQQVNQNLSNSFDEIRYSQANLDNSLASISARLNKLEQDVANLQAQNGHISAYITQTAQDAKQIDQSHQDQIAQVVNRVNTLINEVNDTRSMITNSQTQTQQSLAGVQAALEKRMAALEGRRETTSSRKTSGAGAPSSDRPGSTNAGGDSSTGRTHKVQPGETLNKIAAKYNVSARQIQDLNGVEDPSLIKAGQVLQLP